MYTCFKKGRDPFDSFSHFWGIVFGLAGTAAALITAQILGVPTAQKMAFMVFCLAVLALYGASSFYHYYRGTSSVLARLRKVDHAMIYVLIAGSYTPIYAKYATASHAAKFLGILWLIALAGVVLKVFFMGTPNWVSSVIYIAMGWALMADFSFAKTLPVGLLVFLVLGGLSYTIGGVIYGLKKPQIKGLTFHNVFHLFILGGTLLHFVGFFIYVLLKS